MSTMLKTCLRGLSGLVLACALPFPLLAQTTDATETPVITEELVKKWVLEAILEKPEIIQQAEYVLRVREEERKVAARAEGIEQFGAEIIAGTDAVILGNPDGDITLVEFSDYNCGFCKRAGPVVKSLIDEDPNLRVILREFPILNDGSHMGARAALAAAEQGKYQEFHTQLMAQPRVSETSIFQLAESLGLDVEKLRTDMNSEKVTGHINRTRQYANALAISGTPGFLLGGEVIAGFLPLEQMRERVQAARRALEENTEDAGS